MISFTTAAKAASRSDEEATVDVPIDGKIYKARRPTTIQSSALASILSRGGIRLTLLLNLLGQLMGDEAQAHIERLIIEGRIEQGDLLGGGTASNPDKGLLEKIVEEHTNLPTEPSTDSSKLQETDGRSSTENSQAETSTPSSSPSTDS